MTVVETLTRKQRMEIVKIATFLFINCDRRIYIIKLIVERVTSTLLGSQHHVSGK